MPCPSYTNKLDTIIRNMSKRIRVIYLESDYPSPDILDMVLDRVTGSEELRSWLGLPETASGFQYAVRNHFARRFAAVYSDHTAFGVLKDSDHYRKECNLENPATELKLDSFGQSQPVFFYTPGKECICLEAKLEANCPREAETVNLKDLPVKRYFTGKNVLSLRMDGVDLRKPPIISNDSCLFFYLTNANALGETALARQIQAFLENDIYPRAKLILTGSTRCIPEALSGQIQLIRLGAPSAADIEEALRERLKSAGAQTPAKDLAEYAEQLNGLTYMQLENIYTRLGSHFGKERKDDLNLLATLAWEQKQAESEKDGVLVYKRIQKDPGVVGTGRFTQWFNQNVNDLIDPQTAKKVYGISPPKGVILTGIPGGGKSQLSKQLAYRWEKKSSKPVTYIEFDISKVSSKWVGESEQKMATFLDRISEQEPAVLYIDEIEKIFHKDSNQSEMHDTKKAQMGKLLAWLQEHDENIFTFATCNNISALPPELTRSGRFSERFLVYLPGYYELMAMLYTFLKPKAELKIFDEKFRKDIQDIYDIIERHAKEFGLNDESDKKLDSSLKNAIRNSLLSDVLVALAKAAEGHKRMPFLTGADMEKLVTDTIQWLRLTKKGNEWSGSDFGQAMKACCCDPTYTPYGQSNMENLVDLYLNCDYPFISSQPVLPKHLFDRQTGSFKTDKNGYLDGAKPDNDYDQYLQKVMIREIQDATGEKQRQKKREERQDRILEHQEKQQSFQEKQMVRTEAQWKEEDADRGARKKAEETAREIQKLQLKQLQKNQ